MTGGRAVSTSQAVLAAMSVAILGVAVITIMAGYGGSQGDGTYTTSARGTFTTASGLTSTSRGRGTGLVGNFSVGCCLGRVAYDPVSGLFYAPVYNGSSLLAIDGSTRKVVGTLMTERFPNDVAYDPDNGLLYVATGEGVSVVDPGLGTQVNSVMVGNPQIGFPRMVAYNPFDGIMFVGTASSVVLLNATSESVAGEIDVGNFTGTPTCFAYDNITHDMYVGGGGELLVVAAGSGRIARSIELPNSTSQEVAALAFDPVSNRLYLAVQQGGVVYGMDAATDRIVLNYTVGGRPFAMAMDQGDRELYVSNSTSFGVAVIDPSAGVVANTTGLGRFSGGVGVAGPTSIAYDAADQEMYLFTATGYVMIFD